MQHIVDPDLKNPEITRNLSNRNKTHPSTASIAGIGIRRRARRRLVLPRGERIGALDDPTKRKEGKAGENSGAPGVRIPLAVLSDSVSPLLSEGSWVGVCGVWWIGEMGLLAGVARASVPDFNRNLPRCWRRRRWVLGGIGVLMIGHGLYFPTETHQLPTSKIYCQSFSAPIQYHIAIWMTDRWPSYTLPAFTSFSLCLRRFSALRTRKGFLHYSYSRMNFIIYSFFFQ